MFEDWYEKNGIKEWGLVWTKRQDNRLVRLYRAGISERDIAHRMHRTTGACNQRLAKLKREGRIPRSRRKGRGAV